MRADSVLRGFNGTIFAYGQTGAGKSHTMEGLADKPELRGIIPNSFKHIFDHINANTDPNKQFLVRASYLEIYNEEIRDLLGKDKTQRLELKENVEREVYVKDLMAVVVKSAAEMDTVLQNGKKNRITGATLMNETSSRSHAVFLITLETAETGDDGKSHIRVGKLNLVDLAGCVSSRAQPGPAPHIFAVAGRVGLTPRPRAPALPTVPSGRAKRPRRGFASRKRRRLTSRCPHSVTLFPRSSTAAARTFRTATRS